LGLGAGIYLEEYPEHAKNVGLKPEYEKQ